MPLRIRLAEWTEEYSNCIIKFHPASKCELKGPLQSIVRHSQTRATVKIKGLKGEYKVDALQTVELTWPDQPWREKNMTKIQWDEWKEKKRKQATEPERLTHRPPGFTY